MADRLSAVASMYGLHGPAQSEASSVTLGENVGRVRAWASCLTPFLQDGDLDLDGLRAHCRRLAKHGVGVYVAGSGSGEGFVLSADEQQVVMETAAEELAGRAPVRAMGVEVRTADEMIHLGRRARACGVDAIQIYPLVPGHSTVLRDDELLAYYRTVLSSIELPAVIALHYAAGYAVPLPVILALLEEFDGIVGINYTYSDLRYLTDLITHLPRRVEVVVGGVANIVSGAALGCSGFLIAECNLIPATCGRLATSLTDRRGSEAFDEYRRLLDVHAAIGGVDELSAIKHVLRSWGLAGGYCRPPRQPLPEPLGRELLRRIAAVIRPEESGT